MLTSPSTGSELTSDDVTIVSPNVIQQALDRRLVDKVCLGVVPVLFGERISQREGSA